MQKGKDYIGVGGGCLIFNDKKEVLLIRRAGEVRNEAGWWSKPGGGVKFGETAEKAMIREMKEELGIEVEIVGCLPHTDHIIKTPHPPSRERWDDPLYPASAGLSTGGEKIEHWVALNFIAKIKSGQPKNMEPHKCDKIGWFAMDNLPEKITQTTAEPIKNYLEGKFLEF